MIPAQPNSNQIQANTHGTQPCECHTQITCSRVISACALGLSAGYSEPLYYTMIFKSVMHCMHNLYTVFALCMHCACIACASVITSFNLIGLNFRSDFALFRLRKSGNFRPYKFRYFITIKIVRKEFINFIEL